MARKHIFNPGPAVLPQQVLLQASEAVKELDSYGMSILELSHRSREFAQIIEEAESLLRELMSIPESHAVLFLQGGARLQFAMVALNFLPEGGVAGYADTGIWASAAIKEAKVVGNVAIVASSAEENYSRIPYDRWNEPEGLAYVHLTTNNTVVGTQWHTIPTTQAPLVLDMSSDILGRKVDVAKTHLIYAGAQKNAGIAGVTIVIIRKEWTEQQARPLPAYLSYKTHIEHKSLYNTPCVFGIYCTLLMLRWTKQMGGVEKLEEHNRARATKIYNILDKYPVYEPFVRDGASRSIMNLTFNVRAPLEEAFLKMCEKANIVGIKGHKKVGGFRASLYNALPDESVEVLAEVLEEFGRRYS